MTTPPPSAAVPPHPGPAPPRPAWLRNLPNALTLARLAMTIAFVAILSNYQVTRDLSTRPVALALALFIAAALTDALDGFLARRWRVVSVFGRVMDPLADKVLVLSAFILLAGPAFFAVSSGPLQQDPWHGQVSGVYPWMVVIILTRELVVTSLRAMLESRGIDFSASWTGKAKMIVQSLGIPAILFILFHHAKDDAQVSEIIKVAYDDQALMSKMSTLRTPTLLEPWLTTVDVIALAVTLITALSAIPYITRAITALRIPSHPPPR